jgi:hypothetical protein
MTLNIRYKLDRLYCKECMFGRKSLVENKYDLEKVALSMKGYKSWAEWGEYRRNPKKYVKNLKVKYGF